MKTYQALLASLAFACASLIGASPAMAQATRTWVSGVGDDANPCSRTAPCKTFAGAISKTAAGGEINCLDPGGFGGVTITKAIAITCDYTGGGLLMAGAGTSGVTVNAGPADAVYLSGLDLHGAGTSTYGIRFIAGGALHVRNSAIRMFTGSGGAAIAFKPAATAQLTILNTILADNASGVDVSPSGGTASASIVGSTIVNNSGSGIAASGQATVRVGNSSIAGNGTGVEATGGATIVSYGDNRLHGNTRDGGFSGTAARQ